KAMPTRGARGLALVHVAMYDAYQLAQAQSLEPRLVVSMAAAQVLAYLFPAEERAFDRIAFAVAARLSQSPRDQLPEAAKQALALGQTVGRRVIARGESDGAQRGWSGARLQWFGEGRYYGPGSWEPTPPYFYYPPDEPFAPLWKPWILERADQFRPKPPAYWSAKLLADTREVVEINRNLTPDQLRIAKFWVDGHGSVTPPGHWNQIAIEEVLRAKLDDATTTRLFMELNVALADTFIAVWDTKYRYWTMRPITAAKKLLNVTLQPPILTPPFPSYVSGHAGFSGAAARVIGDYFPDQAQKLDAMAEEAATSRLYGGIHFRHDNEDGLVLGRKVAELVLSSRKP
ncbi:PAP2 superfamily protein, partial [Tahibacter aquaticus]